MFPSRTLPPLQCNASRRYDTSSLKRALARSGVSPGAVADFCGPDGEGFQILYCPRQIANYAFQFSIRAYILNMTTYSITAPGKSQVHLRPGVSPKIKAKNRAS